MCRATGELEVFQEQFHHHQQPPLEKKYASFRKLLDEKIKQQIVVVLEEKLPSRLPDSAQGIKQLFEDYCFNQGQILQQLTYSMVQSPSSEANWFAASQEIPRISRNPKVHYRNHKRPPPVPILGQPNPVHIPTSHLLEIHPNIIHPSYNNIFVFTSMGAMLAENARIDEKLAYAREGLCTFLVRGTICHGVCT